MSTVWRWAVMTAAAGIVLGGHADACICIVEPVTVSDFYGRVFTLEGAAGAEAVGGATVLVRELVGGRIVAEATADDVGSFRLPAVPVGTYELRASARGFAQTALRLKVKSRRWGKPRGIAIRLDIGAECTCGDACSASPREDGLISAECLTRRAKRQAGAAPSNKAMQLTKLPAAPWPTAGAAGCPRRTISDAGTASQLIAGVMPT